MTQINYFSRNKLHSAANLNFGSICKKAKHCWALSSVQLLVFLDHARSWIGAKIQISSKLLYGKVIPWNRITGIYVYVVLCMYWHSSYKCLFYSTDPTLLNFQPLYPISSGRIQTSKYESRKVGLIDSELVDESGEQDNVNVSYLWQCNHPKKLRHHC